MVSLLAAGSLAAQENGPAGGRRVPDLKGRSPDEVRQILRVADVQGAGGIFYLSPTAWREEIDPEVVSLQAPRAGSTVGRGGVVAYWMFAKADPDQAVVETPDLRGLEAAEAAELLEKVGLVRASTSGDGDGGAVVVEQYPRPGQPVYVRTAVAIRFGAADSAGLPKSRSGSLSSGRRRLSSIPARQERFAP